MSEASKTTAKKTSSAKSTAKTDSKTVGASTAPEPTQTKQDALTEEDKAKQEAEAKAKAEANEKAKQVSSESKADNAAKTPEGNGNEKNEAQTSTDGAGDDAVAGVDSLGILGALKVRSKSNQGFWRSGVQFQRQKETILLVVDEEPKDQPEIVAQEDIESELILFMSKEKAERVHREPNLDVETVELSDVIDIEQL
ncbi:hypothetical protein ND926_04525 [Vibrio diabolicus]|uniref:hypothetical protein n=1 Tax=Vibrio harveyi group TaxID=717610 RepID=UPI002160480C|nr:MULTISPECIES: hypothetical protein [Vibrio harveyi group]EKK9971167.1 hypothetical protein [Vibrio parahaemolyticus]MCS0336726.1 hypothetical protein [Vibrio diabolicus]MCZ6309777.1 hypothetical protein [Vibrio parahaemolyticus]MDG3046438.1 hypothetical protein [Vibrio parahaemolyticus]